jgi:cysteine desulfuration protein SufE
MGCWKVLKLIFERNQKLPTFASFKLKLMTIDEVQNEIIEEFSVYEDWMDKYGYLIELGNELKDLDPKDKIDQFLIKGCQSRVWLVSDLVNGKIVFRGESDAVIVKGLVALLLRVVSGRTPEELLNNELFFVDAIGLKQHLSPTRSNGLLSMIKQIKLYAVAYNRISEKGE